MTAERARLATSELIARGAVELGVPLAAAAGRLALLVELLVRWSQRVRVIARCDARTAVDRHVLDGLGLLRLLDRPEVRAAATGWLDVGSGVGLPGLVLAAARPELHIVLVEPIGKKAALAQHAAHELGVAERVEVRQTRLESLAPGAGPPAALSRAALAPGEWLRRGSELVGPGGLVLVTMGGAAPAEIITAAWLVDRFQLPLSGASRVSALCRV